MDYDLNLSIKSYETSIINICLNTKNLLLCVLDIHHLAFVPNIQNSLASSPWPRISWFIWLVQNFSRSFLKEFALDLLGVLGTLLNEIY